MSIEGAIFNLLSNDGAVTSSVSARIYPVVVARSSSHPALTYQLLSADRSRSTEGPTGDVRGLWQIICWSETYDETLWNLVDAVRRALDGVAGTFGGTRIEQCLIAGESDTAAVDPENEKLVFYGRQLNFDIWWNE